MAQRKFLIDGGFEVNDDSVINANLEMAGNILPAVDSDGSTGYDLGSPTAKWRDLYLSQGSLYIDGQKVLESDAGTIVVQADADQSLTTKTAGSGVLTFQSPNPIAIAGTLQIGSTHRITDSAGNSVTFGDKIDMDNNQIINVASPTADAHAATKKYVDDAFDDVINGAPAALDTLNELANALGDDANFASTVTTSLATKATIAYVDAEVAAIGASSPAADAVASDLDVVETLLGSGTLNTSASTVVNAINELKGRADTNASTASANASDIADNAVAITAAIATAATDATTKANDAKVYAQTKADEAQADAEATAEAYTDAREVAITTAYQSYADTAEADAISTASADATSKANAAQATAISTANAYTDTREAAITTAYQSYADIAESDAVSTAGLDASTKANAAQAAAEATASADATSKANAAQAAAISTASADATSKANAAQAAAISTANAYTDAEISSLIDAAPGALDTLNELAAALGDDSNFASSTTTAIATAKSEAISTASSDATSKANAAQAAAEATVASANYFNSLTASHGSPVVVTSAQADSTTAVTIDLGVSGLEFATVYLNRQLLRPTEMTNYNSSNGRCTFAVGVLSTDDELEIVGFSIS